MLFQSQFFRLCPPCWSANQYKWKPVSSSRYRRPLHLENMSEIEYNDLVFDISTKINVNQLGRMVFMCRGQISKSRKKKFKNVLELFVELEEQGNLGIDRLETLKQILEKLKNRGMLRKVKEFENKRKGAQLMLVIFFSGFSEENLKSRKCLFAQEVQFKAYSFFTDCIRNDFWWRGIM